MIGKKQDMDNPESCRRWIYRRQNARKVAKVLWPGEHIEDIEYLSIYKENEQENPSIYVNDSDTPADRLRGTSTENAVEHIEWEAGLRYFKIWRDNEDKIRVGIFKKYLRFDEREETLLHEIPLSDLVHDRPKKIAEELQNAHNTENVIIANEGKILED